MGQPDIAEKYLESYPDVFADIVNVLLFDGRQVIHPEQLIDSETSDMYKCDGKLHENRRDTAKYIAYSGDSGYCIKLAMIGLENQTDVFYLMPARCFEYDAANYRIQLTSRKNFGQNKEDKVFPIVTLVLYFGKDVWDGPTTLKECIDFEKIPKELHRYINDYKIYLYDIPRLSNEQIDLFHSDFRIIAKFFQSVASGKKKFYDPTTIKHVDAFLKMLAALRRDSRFKQVSQKLDPSKEDVNMCTIYDEIEKIGVEKGREEGRKEGIEEGKQSIMFDMFKENKITSEYAAKKLQMEESEFLRLKDEYFKTKK